MEKAWKAGIVVVCAAGNTGRQSNATQAGRDNEGFGTAYGSIQSPGNSPYVITVGAMKTGGAGGRGYDKIATYSSRGPTRLDLVMKPDIVAPGNRVVSLYSFGSTLYQWNEANGNGLPQTEDMVNGASGFHSADYFLSLIHI